MRVPAHFDVEVFGGVRRLLRLWRIDERMAQAALAATARLPAERVALASMLADAYALRNVLSPGDVFYVALASRSSATLVTADAHLARAAAGHVRVRLVSPRDR